MTGLLAGWKDGEREGEREKEREAGQTSLYRWVEVSWMNGWMGGWMEKVREKEAEQTLLHECVARWMDGPTNETVHK